MTILQNRWRRLLAQPVAELAIIVVGITIALWADDWVTDRANQAEEQARLQALLENIDVTLEHLESAQDNAAGGERALRLLLSTRILELPDEETYETLRHGMLFGPTFAPELSVYDDLESSGELGLLSNRNLRRALARLSARLESARLIQDDMATVQQLSVDRFMLDNFDLLPFFGADLDLEVPADQPAADFAFLSNTRFRNIVLLKLDIISQVEIALANVEESLVEIQNIVGEQLEN